jgi:hypothetical protein
MAFLEYHYKYNRLMEPLQETNVRAAAGAETVAEVAAVMW